MAAIVGFGAIRRVNPSGPSSLSADPRTGRLYAVWGSRSAPLGGGCGAFLASGPAISVEGADRIWVATSPDGSPGSWTTTLAVDATTTRSSLGMLFSPAAVDRAGNVYLVYPETPRAYPDYAGATIKYRVAPPGLSRWSAPAVIADGSAARNAGHFATHVVAGAAGRLDVAYFAGLNRPGRTPAWYATMAQVRDATTTRPRVRETRLSPFASYAGTATVLAGVCASGPAAGIEQGLTCPRATDNFGLTLLPDCRLAVVWPAVALTWLPAVTTMRLMRPAIGAVTRVHSRFNRAISSAALSAANCAPAWRYETRG